MKKPPLYLKVWVWLLLNAQHSEYKNLKRGQWKTSIPKIQEAMSYKVGYRTERPTYKQIRDIIDWLRNPDEGVNEGQSKGNMIVTTKVTQGIVVDIVNYGVYQDPKSYEGHTEGQGEELTKETRRSKKGHNNNKNVKNEQEEQEDTYNQLFDFWNSQKIIVHKKLTDKMEKAINKALKTNTKEEVKTAIERFAIMLKDESYKYCKYKWTLDEFLTRDNGYKLFLDDGSKWINYKEGSNGTDKQTSGQATGTSEKKSKWEQFVQNS